MLSEASLDEVKGAWSHTSAWCVDFVGHHICKKRRQVLQAKGRLWLAIGICFQELLQPVAACLKKGRIDFCLR